MYNFQVVIDTDYCNTNFVGAFHLPLKIVKCCHILLSVISMISIVHFFIRHNSSLLFHFNIKILFRFQFIACFLQSAVLGIAQTHHLYLALTASDPCDVVLTPTSYALFNIPLIFSMFCIEFSQILMVIERTLATCLFVCYERTTKTIGYMLTSVAIVMPLSTCAYMYYDDEFNYPQMSSLSTSPHSWAKINYLFLTLTVLNFLTLMHSIGLYRHNQRKVRVAENGDHLGLSSRYQLNENVVSSRLLWWMSTAQLGIFLTYGVSMYSLRLLLTGPRSAGWQAFTELCYFQAEMARSKLSMEGSVRNRFNRKKKGFFNNHNNNHATFQNGHLETGHFETAPTGEVKSGITPPLYCAAMPLLCIKTAKDSQKERNSKIRSMVTIRSAGTEGWDNYQKQLRKQWD